MRRLLTIAAVLTMAAMPAWSQRGGGGHAGGFSGHAAGSRGGFSEGGQFRYGGGALRQGYRPAARGFGPGPAVGATARFGGTSNRHPSSYMRGRDHRRYGYAGGVPYIDPGGYSGWDGYELGNLDDYGNVDNDAASDAENPGNGYAPEEGYGPDYDPGNGPAQEYPPGAPEGYAERPPAQPQQTPEESAQQSAAALAQNLSPEMYDADAVTLVFKDGRPTEKIQNYALTRTTVYVTGEHHREIPVSELDLAATEKANRDAGVEFQLPAGQ